MGLSIIVPAQAISVTGKAPRRGRLHTDLQPCRFVIRPFRTVDPAVAANLDRGRDVVMKYAAIKHIAVIAALVVSSAANAASCRA
jgi:hypothetical protein